jgi:hypothetical protein
MQNLHYSLIMLLMLMSPVDSAKAAQVSIGIGLPIVSIGINLPVFPELVLVPGYPVYYAPQMDSNYFFYDGMYWVYQDDSWYASSWYNGPWGPVQPEVVPLYILRIPVRYYRQPPVYFRGWQSNAPPRWGQHWGRGWEQKRSGWNTWKRSSAPAAAPLPVYQRQYSGDRYPRVEQQQALRNQSDRYQPRDKAVRQHFKQIEQQRAPAAEQRGRSESAPVRNQRQPEPQGSMPRQQGAPPDARSHPPQRGGETARESSPVHAAPQQRAPEQREQRPQPRVEQPQQQREQQSPRAQGQEQRSQGRGESQDSNRDRGQGQNRDEGRGRGRD